MPKDHEVDQLADKELLAAEELAEQELATLNVDINSMTTGEVIQLAHDMELAASRANSDAAVAKANKVKALALAKAKLDIEDLDSGKATAEDGKKLLYYTGQFRAYRVTNPEAFAEWEKTQDEDYFDRSPRLREGLLRDECRRRFDDGEPLPDGVEEYTETRLYHKAA